MKKVLVAINLGRNVGNDTCIKTAHDIAGTMDGTVVLLYVIEPILGYGISHAPKWVPEDRKSNAEEELRKLAEQHGCADVVVREGAPAAEILKHATEINADLIVLHSHDPEMADYFFGSVASRVVRHAHCSVHVVRYPADLI